MKGEPSTKVIWYAGLAVRLDGTIDHYVRNDGRLQLVERKAK